MATAQPQAPTDLALYGGRDEVKELGARLQNYMPNAQKLSNLEAQAVAQIAVAHGLDPFNGEVWGIKGQDGGWYGVMVGVKGLRKCSDRQAKEEGTVYWKEEYYGLPADYGEPANAIVAICAIRDSKTIQAYANCLRSLRDAGMTAEDAREALGKPPVTIGVGIARPEEKSKMKIHARAKKRAESDGLKKRFNVSFGVGVYTESDREVLELARNAVDTDGDAIDGEAEYFTDSDDQSVEPEKSPKKATITAKQNASRFDPANSIDDLFPAEKTSEQRIQEMKKESKAAPRPMDTPEKIAWTNEQINFITSNGYAASNFGATGMLDLSCLKADATEAEIDRWCKLYREIRPLVPLSDSPKAPEAAQKANEQYAALA